MVTGAKSFQEHGWACDNCMIRCHLAAQDRSIPFGHIQTRQKLHKLHKNARFKSKVCIWRRKT